MAKRLIFWSSIAFAKKLSKLHWCEFAAGWLVGSMKNKQAVVASGHRLRSGNLSFSDCHLALCSPIWKREMVVMSAQ